MIELLLLLAAIALVVICGVFVAAEFAFVTIDRATVDRAAESGDARSRGVQQALKTLSTQLSGAQLGITVTNLLIGYLSEPAIAELIKGPLETAGVPHGGVHGVAIAIALVLSTVFTMVLGELVPKNLAIARPLATARAVQGFMRAFTLVNHGLINWFNGVANAILHRLGIEPQEELASARSAEELTSLVRRSAEQGTLELETATLLQRSLTFGDRRADDVMTPRVRMRTLEADEPVIKVIEAARESGFSRFPVVGESHDEVVGIVHVKHAVGVDHERRGEVPISEVMARPVMVPSSIELDPLLAILREGGLQIAVVVDEFGGVDGLVTLEDVVEEIVGEVVDEHDRRDMSARRRPDGSWILSGLLRPDEAARATGILFPEDEEYETLGGLIQDELNRLPRANDEVILETRDLDGHRCAVTLTVVRLDGMRVDRVLFESERIHSEEDEDD
ncbi:hemolysin family protein [Conexibacter sp. JD483]|uniref:hemolysin family protein n=1 Tax=unclassified Conexibacter TaxID=2627773 RepID=UPI002717AAFB|nr:MULTISPECIES: hemolysin family protein [unclassified Conexibacter]MDO8185225.1 hemolysin family protein [Conexibacter sp. CPCC 205706]MDO8198271.1 hemolysin family protein [Conexibacter sp. CPCC 205762]MDR9367767.1 hemolysin family protein [Conexibacter sp. JD483]